MLERYSFDGRSVDRFVRLRLDTPLVPTVARVTAVHALTAETSVNLSGGHSEE